MFNSPSLKQYSFTVLTDEILSQRLNTFRGINNWLKLQVDFSFILVDYAIDPDSLSSEQRLTVYLITEN